MSDFAQRITNAPWFQNTITGVILFAAVLVGAETYPALVERHHALFHFFDLLVLGIFALEIVLKMAADMPKPWRFFADPWNVFDFLIVGLVFLPIHTQYVTVLRLLRLLRVLKLIRAVPRLQIIVGALLKSIPSMGYVSLLLFLVFYVYGVAAVFLFGQNDPFRFGTLPLAFVTLFQVATGEDWSTTLYTQMYGCSSHGYDGREHLCLVPSAHPVLAPVFFISFILLGTMIILNLFIGVIMTGMEEAQLEQDELAKKERVAEGLVATTTVEEDLRALEQKLDELRYGMMALAHKAGRREKSDPS